MTESKKDVINVVKASLRNEKNLELYKPKITDKIKASNKTYVTCTVDTIKKVIKDKKEDGFTKLFALFLLKEVMDTKNSDLVGYVHKKILRRLGIIALGKQEQYFPKDTSSSLIESFTSLLIECIVVWNEWFGVDKSGKPTKYFTVYNDLLVHKVPLPKKRQYFPDPKADQAMSKSGNQSEIKSSTRPKEIDLEASSGARANKPQEEMGSSQSKPKKPVEIKIDNNKEDDFIVKLNNTLKKIKQDKELLLEAMVVHEEPDTQGVVQILQELKGSNKELQTAANQLVVKDFPNKDATIDQVLNDNEVITNLISEYQKCFKGETTFDQYRDYVVEVLSADLGYDQNSLPPSDARRTINLDQQQPIKEEEREETEPKEEVQANKQRSSQKESPMVINSASQQENKQEEQQKDEGFDYDAFEEPSPQTQQMQQQNQRSQSTQKQVVEVERKEVRRTSKLDPNVQAEGSQYSEGGTRKAPRSFQDLFTNKDEGRGRKMTRDRNDSSKGSIKFGASWDNTKPPEPRRNQQGAAQAGGNQEGQGIGFEDFDDLPANTNTFEDSSAISESGMYNFNYESRGTREDRSGSKGRSTFKSQERKEDSMWSPNRNVLGTDEYGIRGSRRTSPNAEAQREQQLQYEREQREQQEQYEREQREQQEKYEREQRAQYEREQKAKAQAQAQANANKKAGRNMSVDTNEANRGYKIEVKRPSEAPSDNFGFGNPFGEEATNGDEDQFGFSGGFGQSRGEQPKILVQNNEPPSNKKQTPRATPPKDTRSVSKGNASLDYQPILGQSTIGGAQTMNNSVTSRFAPIERPSFLNKFDTFHTINMTSMSEGPAMRQADELLERARRLTSQKLPNGLERPSFLASPPPQLLLNDPMRRDDAFKRDSAIKPPVSFAEPIGTVPLFMTAEKIDPFRNASFTQSSYAEGGLLRELEKAKDMSRQIAAQYASPGKRSLSEDPMRFSAVQPSKYLATETTYSPARREIPVLSVTQPTKYLNRETNSPARKESDLRKSEYASPNRGDTSFKSKDLKVSSYFARTEEKQTPAKSETKAYTAAASESKEFARAIELIEKAKRLREESQQRSLKKESKDSTYFKRDETLLRTPKTDYGAQSLKNSRIDVRESSYLERNKAEKPYEGLRKSRIHTEPKEEERFKHLETSAMTFNGRTTEQRDHTYNRNVHNSHLANLPNNIVEIKSHNVQSHSMIGGHEARTNRHEKVTNREPTRLIGPDGKIYEEVRNGVGRKQIEEPRLVEKRAYNVSPVKGTDTRGRSRETKYETLGQLRQSRIDGMEIRNSHIRDNVDYRDYTRSPPRNHYMGHSDIVELRPEQTAKIVERPVPGSVNKRSRSTNKEREVSRDSPRLGYTKEVEQRHAKVNGNRIPPTIERVVSQGTTQAKGPINSHLLAAEIKNELEQLKRSLVVKKKEELKPDSATSKGTLELESYGVKPPQKTLPRENAVWRANEEMKVETMKMNRDVRNGRVETVEERKPGVPGVRISAAEDEERFREASRAREREQEYIRVEQRVSDLSTPITPIESQENSRSYARRLDVREISGIKGVKVTMDNSDMWEEESTLRTRNLEEDSLRREREYKVQGVNKQKWGRFVNYDYYLFDQIANIIMSNGQGKDIDGYKSACLLNKAVLFESARLKIDVITRLEDEQGREDSTLKMILHYGNKSNQSITGFIADILDKGVERNPQINGTSLAPRYQLKQELYMNFFNLKNSVYTIQLSYQHEGLPYGVNLPLPMSINKFMKMSYTSSSEYKKQWKTLKSAAIKSKYKHINAKFIRDHTEVNKYFNNCLVDVTPVLNPKRKRKYGGVFVLPDKREYYLRITMDSSRVKFVVSCDSYNQQQFSEWAVQYLTFLLTV